MALALAPGLARADAALQGFLEQALSHTSGLPPLTDDQELPPFLARRVGETEVRSYPALVDRGTSVDLVLLESAAAAESASRAGVRRLLLLAARGAVTAVLPRLPPALARPSGALASRADHEAFRATVLQRIADAAFALGEGAPLPRDRAAFERLLGAGAPRIEPAFRLFVDAISPVARELEKTLQALRTASKHPSGRAAVVDIYAQLEQLVPADLMKTLPLARLEHLPRYLRAAQARLTRAVTDPRKDTEKLAPVTQLWAAFVAKRATARDQAAVVELRWAFEELRVAVFAPELRTAVPVSIPKLAAAIAALR